MKGRLFSAGTIAFMPIFEYACRACGTSSSSCEMESCPPARNARARTWRRSYRCSRPGSAEALLRRAPAATPADRVVRAELAYLARSFIARSSPFRVVGNIRPFISSLITPIDWR